MTSPNEELLVVASNFKMVERVMECGQKLASMEIFT